MILFSLARIQKNCQILVQTDKGFLEERIPSPSTVGMCPEGINERLRERFIDDLYFESESLNS